VARAVAVQLGAIQPDVTPGVAGSDTIRAWRLTTLALDILNWQSLAPRAAHPLVRPSLPPEAIEKASAYLEDAVRYDPDFGDAWAALGVSQTLLGKSAESWRSFGKATALGAGHHPTAVLGAAFVRMRQGRYDEAATILQNAIARHPGFLHARGYLGELYIERKDWAKAREVFDAYAAQVPEHPWVLAQRGYVRAKQGDFDGAIADSIAAIDQLPESAYLMLELASRYVDAGKLLGAEETLEKAIEKNPDNSSAYVRLGYVYLLQGKDELAIPITEQALANADFARRARDRGYAHLNLVRAYGHQGDLDRAFDHLTKAKAAGVRSFRELTTDPELGELRDDARFEKIVP
jgi:tetratricopeptide (TPR) repeat protein